MEKVIEGAYEVLDRKPIPDNRGDISTRLMEHIRNNPTKGVYEDELFSIRYFQKETAHITFKRGDLIKKMNDIVTKHYPGDASCDLLGHAKQWDCNRTSKIRLHWERKTLNVKSSK